VALAAVVVVLLTIHRHNGPGPLARTMAEYTVVAVLAGLLAAAGTGVDQQPADHPASGRARTQAATGDDQSAMIRAATKLLRAGAALIRVVTGAAHWLVNLWRQADQQASTKGDAMAAPPRLSALSAPSIWPAGR
jgi:hypothetical protein